MKSLKCQVRSNCKIVIKISWLTKRKTRPISNFTTGRVITTNKHLINQLRIKTSMAIETSTKEVGIKIDLIITSTNNLKILTMASPHFKILNMMNSPSASPKKTKMNQGIMISIIKMNSEEVIKTNKIIIINRKDIEN